MSESPEPNPSEPLVGIQHFDKLSDARDASLVLAASGYLYQIDAVGKSWVLLVEPAYADAALIEIEDFAREAKSARRSNPQALPPIRGLPLLPPAFAMVALFQLQTVGGRNWELAGISDAAAILHQHEWWRAVTALTLHADLGHLIANMFSGLLFAAFLQASLGSGVAWLLIVLSGAAGNLINAWGYRHETHLSLGASTAVFGALGLLVAWEFAARWRDQSARHKWQLILPIGAGLSLLAYLGVGETHEPIDFMAHGWGFVAGNVIGALYAIVSGGKRAGKVVQAVCALGTIALIASAWWLALQ